VAGGYYVFEADNLDEALRLAGQIPAAKYGAVEIWLMAGDRTTTPLEGTNWPALLLEPPGGAGDAGFPALAGGCRTTWRVWGRRR
jgi:hypothetical protein